MKRSSLAPPPPAKRTRQPGEEGSPNGGEDDDGDNTSNLVVSSAASSSATITTIAATATPAGVSAIPSTTTTTTSLVAAPITTISTQSNENNHETIQKSNIMFLLNDNDQQQQQQQHRPDSHESRETKSVDEAMHGMNIETAPSSSSDVSTIATTTTATSTITTATVTATATATEKVVPITLVEDKSTSNAIDNAVSATTTNATDNYYVDTVGDNRHSTDGTTRSTSATTTPVKQTQRSNYSSSTLYNPDEDSDDIADLPVWEPTSKRRKKKKDKRKHAFARRGQLDDLVAATDGDAVGMDILPSGNAPFSLTSNPSSSRLDGGIAVASTSSGGNPANMAAAAGRVPMVGMRPTVEYNDINERDVQSGKYRRPMGGGPRGAGMGRGSGGIGASGSGTNKPAINMQNPRLSAGRGDATSHGAGSFASNRFPSSSSSSTSNSITPPNFFGLSSSNATTSATTTATTTSTGSNAIGQNNVSTSAIPSSSGGIPLSSMHTQSGSRSTRASTPTSSNGPSFFNKLNNSNNGSGGSASNTSASRKPELILCTQQTEYDWKPRLILPPYTSGQPGPEYAPFVELQPVHVQPVLGRFFILDPEYRVAGVLPRSCYTSLHQLQIKFSFVFQFPQHSWFEDMAGMRKSAYFMIRERGSNTPWELHLKPARDKQTLFGYICEPSVLRNCAVQQIQHLLNSRRLPLVLDLDDTLVRLISDEDPVRYVPEKDAATVPERIRTLRDGRRVLITPGVEAFLEWASTLYEISVCSLGEQSYVSDVADVLDPNKTRIQGLRHSARPELDFALHRGARDTPPKNLDALYNFCYLPVATPHPSEHGINHLMCGGDVGASSAWHTTTIGSVVSRDDSSSNTRQQWLYQPFFGMPLIVDDTTRSWPASQQDNIVVVRERCPRQRPAQQQQQQQKSPQSSAVSATNSANGLTPMDTTNDDTNTEATSTTTTITTTTAAEDDELNTTPVEAAIEAVNETAATETRPEDVVMLDSLLSTEKTATGNGSEAVKSSTIPVETSTTTTTTTSTDLVPQKEIWSVDLLTWVKEVLGWVHAEFFRRYDRAGLDAVLRGQVTPVVVYKEWLRGLLAERIARSV